MPQLPSPRLPGVNVLRPEATGPEYTRWRRGVKSAFVAKGTWAHCDGSCPMPMPDAGPNFFSPVSSPINSQPELLEERRAWVKKDRDVKLDIFLSVADDIKLEVFEVGPPLPPSAMTAKEMMEALDARFESFKFEEYHHVFCHFLNLHIDQYSNIDDFNAEFLATLEDLLDHGHPMSNAQACSAYFSKLRCTQNPWVTKQLKAWDAQDPEPQLEELMKQSPPWSIIRPLITSSKPPSHQSFPESIPEETLEDTPPQSDGEEAPSEHSEVATVSSKSSHSRHSSRSTQKSQEITVHASYEDLTELEAFPNVPVSILPPTVHKRTSSLSKLSLQSLPPPINRPLPPLPPDADKSSATNSRSVSPNPSAIQHSKESSKSSLELPATQPRSPKPPSQPTTPTLQGLEQIHPALRTTPTPSPEPASAPKDIDTHPALRITPSPTPSAQAPIPTVRQPSPTPSAQAPIPVITPSPSPAPSIHAPTPPGHISSAMRPRTPTPPLSSSAFVSSPNLAPPHLDFTQQRPQSARAPCPPTEDFSSWVQTRPLLRVESNNSSIISLPLQGTTVPEYRDQTITESPPVKKFDMSKLRLSHSPPRGLPGRLSAEASEEEKRSRKRSWSIKARLSARHGIKEII